MATPQFNYPTAAAATSTITFPEGDRLMKDSPQYVNRTVQTARTQDDDLLTWIRGDGKRVFPYSVRVKISSESYTDMDDLIDFAENTVEWSSNTFQWTDENGTVRTVRLINEASSGLTFERFGLDTVITTLLLEVIE